MVACLDDLEAFAFVDGALPPERLPQVIAHADECALCRELIAGLCAADADASEPEVAGFRIEARIATRVYRATDMLGRQVAIKVPRSRSRELASIAQLVHPGVVPIHETGRLADGRPFYVMPLVAGIPLEDAFGRARNRGERLTLLPHLLAIANTIAFAHGKGIAHGELAAQHVLVGRFGE